MGKKNRDVLSQADEGIEFFKAVKNQVPNKNELIMSILDEAEKNPMEKLFQLQRANRRKKSNER